MIYLDNHATTPCDPQVVADDERISALFGNAAIAHLKLPLPGHHLGIHSIDHDEYIENGGSFIDGFCQDYKKTTPYVLSRFAFGITLEKPIYTLAVHELLLGNSDIESKVVYDLIAAIHQHHIIKIFESSNSYLFEANHQDIILSFPFHQGTIDYLNRDQPTFVERYADVMGFALSAVVLLFGLFVLTRSHPLMSYVVLRRWRAWANLGAWRRLLPVRLPK